MELAIKSNIYIKPRARVCVCVVFAGRCHRSAGAYGGRKRTVGLLDLELQAVSLQEQYAVFTTESYVCPLVHHFCNVGT